MTREEAIALLRQIANDYNNNISERERQALWYIFEQVISVGFDEAAEKYTDKTE